MTSDQAQSIDKLFKTYFKLSMTNKKEVDVCLKVRNRCSKLIANGKNEKAHHFSKKDKTIHNKR